MDQFLAVLPAVQIYTIAATFISYALISNCGKVFQVKTSLSH